jgi:thiamine biosynthesis lipoprotein
LGLTQRSAVTVVAPDCTAADSLATALCVLGPQRGLALADQQPSVAALFLTERGGKPEVVESQRRRQLEFDQQDTK